MATYTKVAAYTVMAVVAANNIRPVAGNCGLMIDHIMRLMKKLTTIIKIKNFPIGERVAAKILCKLDM